MKVVDAIVNVWNFYIEGFKNMKLGKVLWAIIIVKLIIMFGILRVFFFQPVLKGKTDEEKSEFVGTELIEKPSSINIQTIEGVE